MRNKTLMTLAALALALTAATGCRVDTHKNGSGDDVNIATPFGGMSVKTNEAVVQGGVGLTAYPGATLVKKDNDQGAADVNIGFGSFHLSVKALDYRTTDAPDKVLAFYRNDMQRYGAVIHCRGSNAIGTPDHTQDGLTCEGQHEGRIHVAETHADEEVLKTGSLQKQHIVAINPDGSGTKIGLVALDLPIHVGSGSGQSQ